MARTALLLGVVLFFSAVGFANRLAPVSAADAGANVPDVATNKPADTGPTADADTAAASASDRPIAAGKNPEEPTRPEPNAEAAAQKPAAGEPKSDSKSPKPADSAEPPASDKPAEPPKPAYHPTEAYRTIELRGWKLLVLDELIEKHPRTWEQTREVVDAQLLGIVRMAPRKALVKLRQIPIWIEYANPKVACMCYHPSRQWLSNNGFNPEKAGAVELGNCRTFLSWTKVQPWMVLHELAHGYHHRFLPGGYENKEIAAAYRRAMDAKRYEAVLYYHGETKRAYAANNPQEYFAELTEAWFGTNDFFPFVRPEVRRHDPEAAELLERLWSGE